MYLYETFRRFLKSSETIEVILDKTAKVEIIKRYKETGKVTMNNTYRKQGYEVVENGIATGKVVFSYDPEEYDVHTLANPRDGMPGKTISSKWFRCDVCGGKFPIQEYMNSWDWSGPHCPNPECGNGGIELFAKREGPVRNSWGVIIYKMEETIKFMEKTRDEFEENIV